LNNEPTGILCGVDRCGLKCIYRRIAVTYTGTSDERARERLSKLYGDIIHWPWHR